MMGRLVLLWLNAKVRPLDLTPNCLTDLSQIGEWYAIFLYAILAIACVPFTSPPLLNLTPILPASNSSSGSSPPSSAAASPSPSLASSSAPSSPSP